MTRIIAYVLKEGNISPCSTFATRTINGYYSLYSVRQEKNDFSCEVVKINEYGDFAEENNFLWRGKKILSSLSDLY